MAKDKKTDYSKLTLGSKIPVKKEEPIVTAIISTPIEELDKVVSAIHGEKEKEVTTNVKLVKPMKTEERTLRVTLDIPLSLHAQIRTKTFNDGISMKEYFLSLAKKDMGI